MARSTERYENYDSGILPLRTCTRIRHPHRAHTWESLWDGTVHCPGKDPLPSDARNNCTAGCNCEHCRDILNGVWPSFLMCEQEWKKLTPAERAEIAESTSDY